MAAPPDRASGPAERQRRYRERQRSGRMVVPVEIDARTVEALVRERALTDTQALDPNAIGKALAAVLENIPLRVTRGEAEGA